MGVVEVESQIFFRDWYGKRLPVRAMGEPVVGTVASIDTTARTLTFTMSETDWDPTQGFGPAPYPVGTSPSIGQSCVAVFIGSDISSPYVIALY